MKKTLRISCFALAATLCGAASAPAQVLFSENFDSLTLGGSVNERAGAGRVTVPATEPGTQPFPAAFSKSNPGWTIDNNLGTYDGAPTIGNAGVPTLGTRVQEWEGWSFAEKTFWITADDQQRSQFTKGTNVVAVADNDEWDDLGTRTGFYNTGLNSPSFPVAEGVSYGVGFDSSWRPESLDDSYNDLVPSALDNTNTQAVEIIAKFDVGGQVQIVKWDSVGTSPFFKAANTNETFASDGTGFFFTAPAGATSASISFNQVNAANDWWWAIDNIKVESEIGATVYTEDFEDTVLEPSINERLAFVSKVTGAAGQTNTVRGVVYETQARPNSFTKTAPAGWSVDNLDTPGLGDDNNGVFEWEGWSFATPEFFGFAAGNDGRAEFTKGTGNIAIADSDEWSDTGAGVTDPRAVNAAGENDALNTVLKTPTLSLVGVDLTPGLALEFDSSWRPEGGQTALITAVIDGGAPVEVLRWNSDSASPFFKARATNESVFLPLNVTGASSIALNFAHLGGSNNWWWAIDNVKLAVIPEPTSALLAGVALLGLGARRRGC
ncbi:MAG: PEP-CTERM sorting domain-containing protein [Lacipirellulaceae bacterium]